MPLWSSPGPGLCSQASMVSVFEFAFLHCVIQGLRYGIRGSACRLSVCNTVGVRSVPSGLLHLLCNARHCRLTSTGL